jgi:hypothetical protein
LTQGFTKDAVLRRDVEKLQKTLGPGQCDAGR